MALYGSVGSLVEMRGYIKDVKPNASADSCDRMINSAIRKVCLRRTWADLLKFVNIQLPNATNSGTVSTQTGSNVVVGSGTTWPVNDAVNTTGPTAVRQPGMQRIIPSSMQGIIPGAWLLLDNGNLPYQEAVVVTDVTANGFYAVCNQTHDANFTITMSSLANQQFRTTYPFYTVIAVTSATQLLLDSNWADITQSGAQYMIFRAYVQPDPYAWRLKTAWDPTQGVPIDVDNWTFDQIVAGDPQMTAGENPTMMAPAPPNAGGVAQWLVYPPQSSSYYLSAIVSRIWPRLIADQDRAPSFVNPDVFIIKAQSDALRTKTITQNMPRDPYYDLAAANEYERQFKEEIQAAEQADEARQAHFLQTYAPTAFGAFSSKFIQTHPGWPTDYN